MRRLSNREKMILVVTAALVVAALVYYGFLAGALERYSEAAQSLEKARSDYEQARELLKDADKVDRRYRAIAATLPKRQPGKTPEALFTEEVDSLLRKLNVPLGYGIKPAKDPEPVPGVPGYAYLVLPVENIQGDLARIVSVLTGLYQQNFLIQKLTVKAGPTNVRDPALTMNVEVAQILRAQDLGLREEEGEESEGAPGRRGAGRSKEGPRSEETELE